MSRALRTTIVALSIVSTAPFTGELRAQWGCGYGFWGAYGYNVYSQEDIPYFSKHPPVYYSRPVARSYGWSPFAYPGYVATPAARVVHYSNPAMVLNPFFKKAAETESQGDASPAVEETMQTVRRPQVIYPLQISEEPRLASRNR